MGESVQQPLELCHWEGLEALPALGKENQQGYKLVNDRLPKGRQSLANCASYSIHHVLTQTSTMGCGSSAPAAEGGAPPAPQNPAVSPAAPAPATAPVAAASEQAKAGGGGGSTEAPLAVPAVPGSLPSDATILFVLGGPGSGKGTQCDLIKAQYSGVVHLSAGDLLRAEVKSGSDVGKSCQTLMKEGRLVPVAVTIQLLKNAMISSGGKTFLIDGFPRALDQAEVFEKDIGLPKCVLFFDCPEEEMQKRLMKRGETSGREDDNMDTIMKRFHTFVNESMPVKDFYASKGLAHVLSAVPPPNDIFAEVQKILDPLVPKKDQAVAYAGAPAAAGKEDGSKLHVPAVPGSIPGDATIIFVLGNSKIIVKLKAHDLSFPLAPAVMRSRPCCLASAPAAGGPGSGKGTQCDLIKAQYSGVVHLSAGDLLRAEVKSGSDVGKSCQTLMKEGKLVPVAVTIQLLKNAMISSGCKTFLIDGFPRAMDQAEEFESSIRPAEVVLFFDCPEEEMKKRLMKRGETSGREDDNMDTIMKRFHTFVNESMPVKEYYGGKGKAFVISAVPAPDQVFLEVKKVLDPLLGQVLLNALPMKVKAKEVASAVQELVVQQQWQEEKAPVDEPGPAAQLASHPISAFSLAKEFSADPPPAPPPEPTLEVPAVPGDLPADSTILFVLGGPGSGKGTQCDLIKAQYSGVVHLSAGDLLRAEVKSGSDVGKSCQTLMKEGRLVPVAVTIQLLKNAMISSGGKTFLIDGFPRVLACHACRALDQAEVFEKDIGLPKCVLFFDCPEEEMQKRLMKRGETSGREDDNMDTIMKRFHTFVNESMPVKDFYASKGLAHVLSAVPPPNDIFAEVQKILDPLVPAAHPPGCVGLAIILKPVVTNTVVRMQWLSSFFGEYQGKALQKSGELSKDQLLQFFASARGLFSSPEFQMALALGARQGQNVQEMINEAQGKVFEDNVTPAVQGDFGIASLSTALSRFGDDAEFLTIFYEFVHLEERAVDEAEMPTSEFEQKYARLAAMQQQLEERMKEAEATTEGMTEEDKQKHHAFIHTIASAVSQFKASVYKSIVDASLGGPPLFQTGLSSSGQQLVAPRPAAPDAAPVPAAADGSPLGSAAQPQGGMTPDEQLAFFQAMARSK
ncbi:hypothetical protein QJQ45_026979 [Haematococcus lacustris]|nr:hypothetical protein QJQ45_026979 [Haematococcus lacustris]